MPLASLRIRIVVYVELARVARLAESRSSIWMSVVVWSSESVEKMVESADWWLDSEGGERRRVRAAGDEEEESVAFVVWPGLLVGAMVKSGVLSMVSEGGAMMVGWTEEYCTEEL